MGQRLIRCVPMIIGLFFIMFLAACGRQAVLQWSMTYDSGHARSVQQTIDGGYIVCGTSAEDVSLMKTDRRGNKLWEKTFDGGFEDDGLSVQQTTDSGYIVLGNKRSDVYYNSEDFWLIKTDVNGDKLWDKTFGGEHSDPGASVQQTTDGGYIVCGGTGSYGAGIFDIWLIKTDANGNKIWDKTFGAQNKADWGHSAEQTTDGGYIVCGYTKLIKTDADGNVLWSRRFDGDSGYAVQQTKDGGYVICGYTGPWGGSEPQDIWLVKTDTEGNKLWDKAFDCGGDDQGYAVQQTAEGGYILCGTSFFHLDWIPLGNQLTLIKTDSQGNKLWGERFGGRTQDYGGKSVRQTADGGYIVGGWKDNNGLLLKIAPER